MGQHTWFYKNKELYLKEQEIYSKLDKYEDGEIFLDDLDLLALNSEADKINDKNDAGYHDLFRTWKRDENGYYTEDKIFSKQECDKWLEDNKDVVGDVNTESLNKFWEEYPNGVIDFGQLFRTEQKYKPMIEQIKQDLARKYENDFIVPDGTEETDFIAGFDSCMDLELPIKFAEWIADSKKHGYSKQLYEAMIINKVKNTKELFTYWIENVYNKEI